MLREVFISGFKCFEDLALPLGQLTLLSGVNGVGKSSVIQALVLLAQTFELREWGRGLLLEGPQLALGNVADILNQRTARRHLVLGAATKTEKILWSFKAENRRALAIDLDEVSINDQPVPLGETVRWLLPASQAEDSEVVKLLRRLNWITAERIGPRELLPLKDEKGHTRVGHHGELAAGLLYWYEYSEVNPALCLPDIPPTLTHQVRAQMQAFFPGCDLRVSPIDGASAVALHWRSDNRSDFQRPQNVGFGLTQLFPIVVALLDAKHGDCLLIENPEVHLHPKAQQSIGRLIAQTAASGVHIIAETHSDHVLNGIRLAVKTKQIAGDKVTIHFFSPASADGAITRISPKMDEEGRLDSWPEGFFDQFDLALASLL